MTPAQVIARQIRCSSGATFLPQPKPAVRAPVMPAPAPIYDEPAAIMPERMLAKCPTQLRVFQLLDDLAAVGALLPARDIIARQAGVAVNSLGRIVTELSDKGLIHIERTALGGYAGIQIISSGKWERS